MSHITNKSCHIWVMPHMEENELKIISTAKISNIFSLESPYISNTFSRESLDFQISFHMSKESPCHSKERTGKPSRSGDPNIWSPIFSVSGHTWVMSCMSHVTYESCHIWAMSHMSHVTYGPCHVWISHVTRVDESCHVRVMSRTSHVTYESCHIRFRCEAYLTWVMSLMSHVTYKSWHIRTRLVTYVHDSYDIQVMSRMSHVTDESCHGWVMSRMSHVTDVSCHI